jgi:6-phosphofructokinase
MGRDAGWLTGGAAFGEAQLALVPEFHITKERKQQFFEAVKEAYFNNPKKCLLVAVSEGVRWYDDKTEKVDVVYASSETDEYGHPRFGGVSGVIASEITNHIGVEARAQISGYFARSGECQPYDRRLTQTLADKVVDLLIRRDYGQMPVLNQIVHYRELEEFYTSSIDMGDIGNKSLNTEYYDPNTFRFTEAYHHFLSYILGHPDFPSFDYEYPKVIPRK